MALKHSTGSCSYGTPILIGGHCHDGRNGVSLTYNHLNLSQTATKSGLSLAYTYDAMGRKLKKVSTTGTTATTDYLDGIQYTNGTIDFIQTGDGIARKNGNSYSYEYNLSDHLGNVRTSFDIYLPAVGRQQCCADIAAGRLLCLWAEEVGTERQRGSITG